MKNRITLHVTNETSQLEAVILGIGIDRGEPMGINPVSLKHIQEGTFPKDEDILREIQSFEEVLTNQSIKVYRPVNIPGTDQIFTRDIGFVVDDFFVKGGMKYEKRREEIKGIQYVLDAFDPGKILTPPKEATIEGGDVILWNNHIFVGISHRTNWEGYAFLKQAFPQKEVIPLKLVVNDDPYDNVLHLDCIFQPVGKHSAILYEPGFEERPGPVLDLFKEADLIRVSQEEKYRMFPNVFSISEKEVVVEEGFERLKEVLIDRGMKVFEISYRETSKFGGLLRCSTLPLRRRH